MPLQFYESNMPPDLGHLGNYFIISVIIMKTKDLLILIINSNVPGVSSSLESAQFITTTTTNWALAWNELLQIPMLY